jgi:hypothetical protein
MKRWTAFLGGILLVVFISCKKDTIDPMPAGSTLQTAGVTKNDTTATTTGTIGTKGQAAGDTTKAPQGGQTTTVPPTTGGTTTSTTSGTTTTGGTTTSTGGTTTTTAPATGGTTTKTGTGTTTTTPTTGGTATKTGTGTATTGGTTIPVTSTSGSSSGTTTKTGTGTTTTGGTTTKTGTGTTTTTGGTATKTGTTPTTGTTTTTKTGGTGNTTTTPAPVQATSLPGVYGDGVHDDTRALQALLNAGNVTLASGKVYNVTGLNVIHLFNLNGATISMTGSYSQAIRMNASGAIVTNGNITGKWSSTAAANVNGASGIAIFADNASVSYVNVSSFPAYGITSGGNNTSITNCTIKNTGYIGFYFDAETKSTVGGTFSNNTVDRSMLPASTVTEGAVEIRASVANAAVNTSNWTISNNVIKMPSKPTKVNAECMEVRYMINSTVSNNTFIAGSIGCSVVRCTSVTVSANSLSGSNQEAIEFADSHTCTSQKNIISSSLGEGIMIDGGVGSNGITISGETISGTKGDCIHAYNNTQNVTITGCTVTAGSGNYMVNLQGTNTVKILNSIFKGNNVANTAVVVDTCPGNISISGGSVSNCKSYVVSIYSAKAGLVTNNVTMSGTAVTGVPRALSSVLENGALLGSNIAVKL